MFQLDRLVELSKALPASKVENNTGDLPVTQDPNETPRTGLSIEDTINQIETCNSWMVLKRVENNPEYKALLDACLDEMDQYSRPAADSNDHHPDIIVGNHCLHGAHTVAPHLKGNGVELFPVGPATRSQYNSRFRAAC